MKLKTTKRIREINPHAKFGKDRQTFGCVEHPRFGRTYGATFFSIFFAPRPGRTARPAAANDGSKRVSRQRSAFWGLNNDNYSLGIKPPKT